MNHFSGGREVVLDRVPRVLSEGADFPNSLISRAVRGEPEALATLLKRHGPAVRRRVIPRIPRRFRSLIGADDVMQETYAEAFLSVGRFDPRGSFAAWLARIAHNNLLDAIRYLNADRRGGSHRRIQDLPGEERLLAWIDMLIDGGTTPTQFAKRQELGTILNHALHQLPDAYRAVVQLYDLEGRHARQVSEMLGCSAGAVFMRRARAHRMLREVLDQVGSL